MDKYPEFHDQLEKFKMDGSNIEFFSSYANLNLRSKPEYVKGLMERVLAIAVKNNYQIASAYCFTSIGWYYHDVCDYEKAIDYHSKANRIFSENNYEAGIITTCNALMGDYMQLGFFDISIEWGLRGINLAEGTENKGQLVPLLLNTGTSYVKLGYYDEAREIFDQVNIMNYQLSKENTIILYQVMAELEYRSGNIEKAAFYTSKGYEIADGSGYDSVVAEIILTRAQVNTACHNYEQAEKDFENAAQMSKDVKEFNIYCSALIYWGEYHTMMGELVLAEKKLLEADKIAKEIKSKPLVIEVDKKLAVLYKKMENYKKALIYMEYSQKYEKEIFNNQSSIWMARMQDKQIRRDADVYKSLYDQIGRISLIGQKITSDLNLENILDTIYYEVNHLLNADIFGIATYSEKDNNLDYALFIEKGQRINMGYVAADDETSLGAYCIKNKTDIMINDIENEYQAYIPNLKIRESQKIMPKALIYCPLMIGSKITGFINIQSYNKNAYTVNDLNTLRILASYVAIAIENAALFKEIEYSASHDYLTGLLNRREIFKEGVSAFERFQRYNEDICVIMIDIDNFKKVNDTYGHCIGDEVIKKTAEIIKNSIRKTDFAGRYGGEEFILVLSHSDINMAMELAERIRRTIESCRIKGDEKNGINVTISLGVFQYSKITKSFDEGVDFADDALYHAKRDGKNRVVSYK